MNSAYSSKGWEPFFIFLCNFASYLGISYDLFRWIFKVFCVYSLYQLVNHLRQSEYPKLSVKNFLVSNYLLALTLPIFIHEFFSIRIRVGLAFCLFCWSFINFIKYKNLSFNKYLFLTVVFLTLALFTHKLGAFILIFMGFIPIFSAFYLSKKSFFWEWGYKGMIFLGSCLILYIITYHEGVRGYNLYSELNPYRLFFISILPILTFGHSHFVLRTASNDFLILFERFFSILYLSMAIVLFLLFMLSLINQTGEAIVRVFTLSSCLGIILVGTSNNKIFMSLPCYLLVTNELFFIHTIHLFGIK